MYHIDMQEAHAQVALLCMCYVASLIKRRPLTDTETALQIPSDQKTDNESLPLHLYTFSHGFRHLACLESANGAVMDGMIALRLDIEQYPFEWRRIMMWELATLDLPSGCPPPELHSQHDFIIYILIFSLPDSFLRAFLRRAPFKAFDGTSPLIYATYSGKFEHAKTLLSCGVSDVNRTGLDVRSPRQVLPLEVAFHLGNHSLFDLFLLDWRAAVPPRLFSSVFDEWHPHLKRHLIVTKLLQCDEFAEWVAAGQHGQSLLRALDYIWSLIVQSVSEQDVLTVLRRLAQVSCNFSIPNSLESVLRVTLIAASHSFFAVLLYLCSLDVPIPSRALFFWRTTPVQELTLRGLDVNAVVAHGDIALHHALGKCKHGSSCWAPDCNLCSVFLRVIGPQVSHG